MLLTKALHEWDRANEVYAHAVPMLAWLWPSTPSECCDARVSERAQRLAMPGSEKDRFRHTRHTRRVIVKMRGCLDLLPPIEAEPHEIETTISAALASPAASPTARQPSNGLPASPRAGSRLPSPQAGSKGGSARGANGGKPGSGKHGGRSGGGAHAKAECTSAPPPVAAPQRPLLFSLLPRALECVHCGLSDPGGADEVGPSGGGGGNGTGGGAANGRVKSPRGEGPLDRLGSPSRRGKHPVQRGRVLECRSCSKPTHADCDASSLPAAPAPEVAAAALEAQQEAAAVATALHLGLPAAADPCEEFTCGACLQLIASGCDGSRAADAAAVAHQADSRAPPITPIDRGGDRADRASRSKHAAGAVSGNGKQPGNGAASAGSKQAAKMSSTKGASAKGAGASSAADQSASKGASGGKKRSSDGRQKQAGAEMMLWCDEDRIFSGSALGSLCAASSVFKAHTLMRERFSKVTLRVSGRGTLIRIKPPPPPKPIHIPRAGGGFGRGGGGGRGSHAGGRSNVTSPRGGGGGAGAARPAVESSGRSGGARSGGGRSGGGRSGGGRSTGGGRSSGGRSNRGSGGGSHGGGSDSRGAGRAKRKLEEVGHLESLEAHLEELEAHSNLLRRRFE